MPTSQNRERRPPKAPEERALILAALIHPDDMAPFHELRRRFFPGHRNYLSAHITLFHYIRPTIRQDFMQAVEDTVRRHPAADGGSIPLAVTPPFCMGKGVAYGVEAEPLMALRQPLRERFGRHLKSQDARPWKKPHITVQNKVDSAAAKNLARHLKHRFRPCTLRLQGLACYGYDYGPWTLLQESKFS